MQQLIALTVIVIEASCLQFWNGQCIVFQRHVILIENIYLQNYHMKLFNKISMIL